MSYIDNGITGLTLRGKLNNQLTNYINVKDKGALADGVTNDSEAFQSAIDDMALNGGTVVIPSGTYRLDTEINNQTFTRGKDCNIIGMGNVLLDFSNKATEDDGFDLGSTLGADTAITADIVRGATSITSALSVVRGDIIELYSTDSWGGYILTFHKRELAEVLYSNAGIIYVDRPLYDSYDKTTTVIRKRNSAKCFISGIKMKGNDALSTNGINLRNFNNMRFQDCELLSFLNTGLSLNTIYGGVVTNNYISNATTDGFGYGIIVTGCQNLLIANNTVTWSRHCIAMGTCSRSVIVKGNYVSTMDDHVAPLENHESCEYITFEGNFLWGGGILLRGLNNNVLHNTIYASRNGMTGVYYMIYGYPSRINKFMNIVGNRIIPSGGINIYGIRISFDNDATIDNVEKVTISDNIFETDLAGFFMDTVASVEVRQVGTLLFNGNNFITTSAYSSILITGDILINKLLFTGGNLSSLSYGMNISCKTGSGTLSLNGVTMDNTNNPIHTPDGDLTNIFVKNCHLKSDAYLNIKAAGNVILQNNVYENMIKGGIKVIAGTPVYTHGGNVKINCAGVVENAATVTNDGTDY